MTVQKRTDHTPTREEATRGLIAAALGLPTTWTPDPADGETERRAALWSVTELNTAFQRLGGTVTLAEVTRTTNCGTTYDITEITLTITVPEVGEVQAVTDWNAETEPAAILLPVLRAVTAGAGR
jgi:hypothetical protein